MNKREPEYDYTDFDFKSKGYGTLDVSVVRAFKYGYDVLEEAILLILGTGHHSESPSSLGNSLGSKDYVYRFRFLVDEIDARIT